MLQGPYFLVHMLAVLNVVQLEAGNFESHRWRCHYSSCHCHIRIDRLLDIEMQASPET